MIYSTPESLISPREIHLKDNTAKAIHLSGSVEKAHKLTVSIPLSDHLMKYFKLWKT